MFDSNEVMYSDICIFFTYKKFGGLRKNKIKMLNEKLNKNCLKMIDQLFRTTMSHEPY